MPSCVLRSCQNSTTKNNKDNGGITFHRFPRIGHEKREAWIRFVQRNRREETWLPSQYTLICSNHFKPEDKYTTKSGRLFLKKNAVPYDDSYPKSGPSDFMESISEPVSDSESIFDSPQEIMLKHQLLKERTARKLLAKKFKKIQRQNRYLNKKCESYKLMIKDLKKGDTSDESESSEDDENSDDDCHEANRH